MLIALLPLHAFLVTVGTKFIEGPDHAPLPWLALWKEALLGLILLLALFELMTRTRSDYRIAATVSSDVLDWLIIAFVALGTTVSVVTQTPLRNALLGFRYDFIPLTAFLILRRMKWSNGFGERVPRLLLVVGTFIAVFGLIGFFLPQSVFRALGYADLHSLYQPNGPLAPYQQIGSLGLRRIQSTMSGPNQLGIWLLVPLSIAFVALGQRSGERLAMSGEQRGLPATRYAPPVLAILLLALALTFSRSAWLGAMAMLVAVLWLSVPRAAFWRMTLGMSIVLALAGIVLLSVAPGILLRATSNEGHIQKPLHALQTMIGHPLGLGLGTAGPASNRTSDTCVAVAGDWMSWVPQHPELCAFIRDWQVYPLDRTCRCPLLTENWYLQLGVEMGWMGILLSLALTVLTPFKLIRTNMEYGISNIDRHSTFDIRHSILLAFLGVSVAALTLHAWEDSAVAYTVWILLAITLSMVKSGKWTSR